MKNKIIEKLLKDNHITAEEATILLKEVRYIAGIDPYKDENGLIGGIGYTNTSDEI